MNIILTMIIDFLTSNAGQELTHEMVTALVTLLEGVKTRNIQAPPAA